jgi:mono/diheme cytochrome c family protein
MVVLAGVVGLFLVVVLVGLVGPSLPVETPGARSSELPFTDDAIIGQEVYASTGCGSCHTQMVRPVVADVGLGAVTLNDTNQILGSRRFGPDLSDVGSRLSGSQIEATIGGLGAHPAHNLSEGDMAALVSYLVESATSPPSDTPEEPVEGEAPAGEDGEEPAEGGS